MVVVDTGPLVGLFDPEDPSHEWCVDTLRSIHEPLSTTVPVLTEAFHLLGSGARTLVEFIVKGGMRVWFLDAPTLARAFELMDQHRKRPIDFADASLLVAAERLSTRKFFTVDRRDFRAYRVRIGHRNERPKLVGVDP